MYFLFTNFFALLKLGLPGFARDWLCFFKQTNKCIHQFFQIGLNTIKYPTILCSFCSFSTLHWNIFNIASCSVANIITLCEMEFFKFLYLIWEWSTLVAEMFRVGDFWLKTRIIIKISSHPWYPRTFDWFSWGWTKK